MLQSKGVATPFDLHGLHLVHWQKLENKTDCMNTNEPPNFISGITFLNTIELTKHKINSAECVTYSTNFQQ